MKEQVTLLDGRTTQCVLRDTYFVPGEGTQFVAGYFKKDGQKRKAIKEANASEWKEVEWKRSA